MKQTFIMVKPDGVQRGLVGVTISKFEKDFSLKGLRLITVDCPFAEKHYADLSAKPFFSRLVGYIISGPVVAMIWEGENVVLTGQKIIGATNPSEYAPGTIRGDFAVEIGRNVIHGSDSVESARKEIALWFPYGSVNRESGLRHLTSEYNIDSLRRTKENLDLRDKPYGAVISRVRDQGGSGICWAMAIISVMEIVIAKQHHIVTILSPQEMVDSLCAKLESLKLTPKKDQFGGYAMDIGTVFEWMKSFGVAIEGSHPSVGHRQKFIERLPGTQVACITNYTEIDPNHEELMIAKLREGFCLCASFRMFEEFKTYKYEENAVYEGTSAEAKTGVSGHAVVITGYGTTPRGKKFWWIKNSWGDKWGDKGFGKLYRGSDAFNPETDQRDLNLLFSVIVCEGIVFCRI